MTLPPPLPTNDVAGYTWRLVMPADMGALRTVAAAVEEADGPAASFPASW